MEQKKEILLFEKDSTAKQKFAELFESWGFNVSFALDSIDAIQKVKEKSFDLFVTNFEIEEEALELLKNVKETNSSINVLFVAKSAPVNAALTLMRNGASDFLIKPITSEQLMLVLQNIFEQQKSQSKTDTTYSSSAKILSDKIVTQNSSMLRILEVAKKVADSNASVLIQGESGTGKELFANFIHKNSKRRDNNFVAINCAVLPENLLESELFGHEKGAFTGAVARKMGKFELADKGTIFLDEITEMQYKLQAKILRVIQERQFDRIGGLKPVDVDVRIVASTNRNIEEAIKEQQFREDLFYRLNVVPLKIPPLRYRKDDLEILISHFIEKYNSMNQKSIKGLSKDALKHLESYPFKGNVRELENIIQRAVLFCDSELISKDDLFIHENYESFAQPQSVNIPIESNLETYEDDDNLFVGSLRDIEKKAIFHKLKQAKGNRTHASKLLGISIRTLRNKLNEYESESFE